MQAKSVHKKVVLVLVAISAIAVAPLAAKPLVGHSEETSGRLCLAGDDTPERRRALCMMALEDAALTPTAKAELLVELGDAYMDLNETRPAEAAYREAIDLAPYDVGPLNGLGWLLWTTDRESEAIPFFQRSLDLRATSNGLSGLASSMFYSGDYDIEEVITLLDAALAISPDDPWILREKGWILRGSGQPEQALLVFESVLAKERDDANALYGLARSLTDLKEYEKSLDALARAHLLDADNIAVIEHRAFVLRRLDRNAQAIPDAERVIALAPSYSGGYILKARALVALERRGEALRIFADAVKSGLADNALLYWYADTLSDDDRNADALEVIDAAIAANGSGASDYNLKAYIANKLQDYENALNAADEALERDPDFAFAHYHAAVALLGRGDTEAGIARFDRAMETGLPVYMISEFARELIGKGKLLAAIGLRRKY